MSTCSEAAASAAAASADGPLCQDSVAAKEEAGAAGGGGGGGCCCAGCGSGRSGTCRSPGPIAGAPPGCGPRKSSMSWIMSCGQCDTMRARTAKTYRMCSVRSI